MKSIGKIEFRAVLQFLNESFEKAMLEFLQKAITNETSRIEFRVVLQLLNGIRSWKLTLILKFKPDFPKPSISGI